MSLSMLLSLALDYIIFRLFFLFLVCHCSDDVESLNYMQFYELKVVGWASRIYSVIIIFIVHLPCLINTIYTLRKLHPPKLSKHFIFQLHLFFARLSCSILLNKWSINRFANLASSLSGATYEEGMWILRCLFFISYTSASTATLASCVLWLVAWHFEWEGLVITLLRRKWKQKSILGSFFVSWINTSCVCQNASEVVNPMSLICEALGRDVGILEECKAICKLDGQET